jgi:deoxyhypusine synthase
MKKIKQLKIKEDMSVKELVENFKNIGFGANKINKASEIYKKMIQDQDCKVFLGLAGAMVPGGLKEVIIDMLDDTDVFVTTGANLTHDLIESLGEYHFLNEEELNDEELNKKGIDRIHNVLMENKVYEKLEKFFKDNFDEFKKCKNIKELLWEMGRLAPNKSILKTCYEKKIPIFCPALADSGIGLMIWGRKAAGDKINIDAFEDMSEIIDISWTSKKSGVFYIGGGTPKNFIQQSLQFSKGASYGIQITTDRHEPGGSSGAPLKEGISWGKLESSAEFVDVFCDATIAVPLIYASSK